MFPFDVVFVRHALTIRPVCVERELWTLSELDVDRIGEYRGQTETCMIDTLEILVQSCLLPTGNMILVGEVSFDVRAIA